MVKTINQIPTHPNKDAGTIVQHGRPAYVCYVCGRISTKKRTRNQKVMCSKHYKQEWRKGRITDENPRTGKDLNEIRIYDDHAELDVYDNAGNVAATVILDVDSVDDVKDSKWSRGTGNYILTNRDANGKRNSIHRVILHAADGVEIDHIDNNPLNNRKSNLRPVTHLENTHNQPTTPTGYRRRPDGKFVATISENNNQIHIGVYENEIDAVFARQFAETLLRGEFAYDREDIEKPTAKRQQEIMLFVIRQASKYIDILGTGKTPELAWDNPDRPRLINNRDVKTPSKS